MEKRAKWSWSSALIGAASAAASVAIVLARPKTPKFHLVSIKLTSLKPIVELILNVHVSNPNVAPINYGPTSMSIFYNGSLLGSAKIEAGSQGRNSCRTLKLPAKLDGKELANQAKKFLKDVAKREMVLDAAVDIEGTAKLLLRDHKFKIHVDSHLIVDPVLLDVIDQENTSVLKLSFL